MRSRHPFSFGLVAACLIATAACAFAACGSGTDETALAPDDHPPGNDAPGDSAPRACPADPCLSLGTGTETFIPLVGGDAITIYRGVQGGFHLFASVRVKGVEAGNPAAFDPRNPLVDFVVRVDGQPIDLSEPLPIGLVTLDEGTAERVGRRVVLDERVASPLAAFDGTDIRLEVAVEDARGTIRRGSVDLVAQSAE